MEERLRYRHLSGNVKRLWDGLTAAIPLSGILFILNVPAFFGLEFYKAQYVGLFLGLMLAGVFIGVPAGRKAPPDRVPGYDWLLAGLSVCVGFYLMVFYPEIAVSAGRIFTGRVILGCTAVLLIVEALRRMVGWVLVSVVAAFIAYAFAAPWMPGPLHAGAIGIPQLATYLYFDATSLLWMAGIAATIALAFLLFGQVLMSFGGSDMINDFALALFGRFRGGPAKGAVIGSSLVGTITGGPMANVMLTGSVTIPLMKRLGYKPEAAGAIEAIASSGGQIMPPVMGIAAFVMAEYLGIPYVDVAIAALIPSLLFYLSLFVQVDLLAAQAGMKGLAASAVPTVRRAFAQGWIIIPALSFLVYMIFIQGYDPASAGVRAAGFSILLLCLRKEMRREFLPRLLQAMRSTGLQVIEVGVVLAGAGIIVGITAVTGLGFNLTMSLLEVGEQSLFLLLLVSAVGCIILGMGMPSVAAYALVAVLIAPAIAQLGVLPLAAHLFIFYFAVLSNITPPIALACFAAAPIAGASPNRIGYEAMKLGTVIYIIPFLFVYSPSLILEGPAGVITASLATAVIGVMILAVGVVGYLYAPMHWWKRTALIIAGIGLLIPLSEGGADALLLLNLGGALLAAVILLAERRNRPRWSPDARKDQAEIGLV